MEGVGRGPLPTSMHPQGERGLPPDEWSSSRCGPLDVLRLCPVSCLWPQVSRDFRNASQPTCGSGPPPGGWREVSRKRAGLSERMKLGGVGGEGPCRGRASALPRWGPWERLPRSHLCTAGFSLSSNNKVKPLHHPRSLLSRCHFSVPWHWPCIRLCPCPAAC